MPYPAADSIPPAVQALLDARPPRNIFRMMAHAPALMPGIMELTGAVLYRAKLDPVLRELVILRVGHLCGSSYEVAQHRKIAQAIGLPQAKIDGTALDADPALYVGNELLVLRMTEQVVRKVKADDELFAALTTALGHELTMELLVVIGLYVMLAQVLENTEVALEEGGGPSQQDVRKIFAGQGKD
jgi:alkylhydroperoxidase family enzyme